MRHLGLLLCLAVLSSLSLLRVDAAPPTLGQACPLLGRGPLAAARLVELPAGVLLRADSMTITEQDVNSEISKAAPELRSSFQHNRLLALERLAVRQLLAREAEQWAKKTDRETKETEAARVQAYLGTLTAGVAVTEAELRRAYDENKDSFGGVSFEDVKPQLSAFVLSQQRDAAVERYTNSLSERVPVEMAETWVQTQYRQMIDNPVDRVRLSGRPSLVDFGAEGCMACETMAPILALLGDELKDKANVLFVDVRKEQMLGARFGVRTIPLQVFFDRDGKEVFRHVGVFPETQIRAKLAELGVR